MIQAMNSALQGLSMNQSRWELHASRIARDGAAATRPSMPLATAIVGARSAQRGYEANLAVLETADEMLGSLIDVLA